MAAFWGLVFVGIWGFSLLLPEIKAPSFRSLDVLYEEERLRFDDEALYNRLQVWLGEKPVDRQIQESIVSSTKSWFKVAIVAPTCFYYQAALFRQLAAHPRIDLTVYFCSDEGLSARDVHEMYRVDGEWGQNDELLEGYQSKFLRNYAPRPSYLKWPFGLINFGILKWIIQSRPDAVILMSWMNPTWWMALAACVFLRIPFFYMTDANVQIEQYRSKRKRQVKQMALGKILFKLCSGFLCAGTANKLLYRLYGVPERKLFQFAYSWGYDSLRKKSAELKPQRGRIRAELGIPEESLVILFCGRLSREKNLFHLIEAYHRLDHEGKHLILVGDGDLKHSLGDYVDEIGAESVRFFGFQSRDEIPKYYTISDLLVLPSVRETWGIVVNEAMCFGLPVIVSNQVGAGVDLIANGRNGYRVPPDGEDLFVTIQQIADLSEKERLLMGKRSIDIMKEWSNRNLSESLVEYIETIRAQRDARG